MKILQVAEAVHPSFGGIAEGIFQQGIELRALGHQVDVASGDDEVVDRLCQDGSKHFAFRPEVKGWRWSRQLRIWMMSHVKDYDIVVLNGLWMGPIYEGGRAARLAGVPYVVMPHGMLDPYFLGSTKQRLVKRIYWTLLEGRTARGSKGLFFTARAEEDKARSAYPLKGIRAWQVGYGIRDPQKAESQCSGKDGSTKLLFMSRVHPKKGLEITINALLSSKDLGGVSLDICGEGDPAYVESLKCLASTLGQRVIWHGFTTGEDKWKRIHECDAMVLTSHQENFGVIVAEAMSLSRPVLISREVNIWQEIEEDHSGLTCLNTVESAAEMMKRFAEMSSDERLVMGKNARRTFLNRYTIQQSVCKFERALKEAAA